MHLRRTSEIVLSIVLLLNVMESVRKHKLGSCSMLLLKWKFQITAFEVMLAQAGKALVLEHLGSGTGERNGHQLALHIQVPATPERVDATIAIDGVAVQSQALQVVQSIESVHRQLGQLVVVHDPGRREGQCRKLVEGHPKQKGESNHQRLTGDSDAASCQRARRAAAKCHCFPGNCRRRRRRMLSKAIARGDP